MGTKPAPLTERELIGRLDLAADEMRRIGDRVDLSLVPTPNGGKES